MQEGAVQTDPSGLILIDDFIVTKGGNRLVVEAGMTSSGDGDDPGWRPARFAVGPPSPNPFRATTALGVDIPATGDVVIEVYDIHGRLVRRIAEGAREPGRYSVAWDGRDERGAEAAAGIYLFRTRGAGFESVRKGIRIR